MYRIILTLVLLLTHMVSNSQDFPYGKISKEDFQKGNYAPHAEAIVLHEYGKARIEYHEIQNNLVLRYYYHTKILIKNKEGLEYANFSVPLYKNSNSNKETIEGIKGTTYNLLENGSMEKTDLEKKDILTEKSSENVQITKIALANVKEGCIIELRYSTTSPYLYNLESWQFQSYIPKMHSEFISEIPDICVYNVNMKGYVKLAKRTQLPYDTKIATSTGEVRGIQTTYVAKDIPAFVSEEYMTSAKNFMAKLTFELASFSIPFGQSHNFSRNWIDVKKQLFEDANFGKELNRSSVFKTILPTFINDNMSSSDKANAIYHYIKSQIRWNKSYGLYSENGVKKALEQRVGNTADINFALISALRAANLEANPVILSTRDNGIPSIFQPTISDYNYVIAHVQIDSQVYLLDASDFHAPFGQIPLRCVNYQGKLFKGNDMSWVPLTSNITSKVSYDFEGELDENGNLKGQLIILRNGYAATNKREEIKGFNSLEEYKESIEESTNNYQIVSHDFHHLDDNNQLLTEIQTIDFKNFASKNAQEMKIIPFITGRTTKNPFNLDERTYPVDLGSTIEESFSLSIQLPPSYKIKSKPKNMSLSLPNRDARYLYIIKEDDGLLTVQVASMLNKPTFMPEEYLDLKEFFSQIIQSQSLDISISNAAI